MRQDIGRAVEVLRGGGLVAFPTETVYGLGADAASEIAVRKIFAAKGRPADHPLIVHLGSAAQLGAWAESVSQDALRLASAFWPGPLTLILPRAAHVLDVVTGGQPTVGLRVPDHPLALELLAAFGGGLAAPSANRFGSVSPTRAEDVVAELGDAVDLVLDGGPCRVGVESSIVDLSGAAPVLLRPGGVTREALEQVLGREVGAAKRGKVRAPGTLASHYKPRAEVRLVSREALEDAVAAALGRRENAVVLGERAPCSIPRIDLPEASEARAQRLYAALREVDRLGYDVAIVAQSDESGLGLAIADRLRRASAPRPDGT